MNSTDGSEPESGIEPALVLSKTASRLSLLTGVFASQAYLIHAIFFAHALIPVEVYVVDPKTQLHLLAGQNGNIEEVFHWNGLLPTMLISVVVLALGWMAARGAAKLLSSWGSKKVFSSNQSIYQLAMAAASSDVSTASTGESYERYD
jgi:hypothetical protein